MLNIKKNKIIIFLILIVLIILILIYFNGTLKNNSNNDIIEESVKDNKIYKNVDDYLENMLENGDEKHNKAISNLKLGKYEEAVKELEVIYSLSKITDNEIVKVGDGLTLVSAYLNYGTANYKEEEYSKKARDLLNSLGINKDSGYYNYYTGYSFEIIKNYEKALSNYNKAITLLKGKNYPLSMVYNQIGHVYDLKGDNDTAYENYIKSYEYNKDNLSVNTNLGRVLVNLKKVDEAIPFLEHSYKNTNNIYNKSELAYTLSSVILFSKDKNNLEKAFNYANRAIEINPKSSNGYMIRGKVLYFAGKDNFEEAKNSLEKAIELYKYNYSAYEVLGMISLDLGKNDEALTYFNKSYGLIDKDISLMENQRSGNKSRLEYFISITHSLLGNNDKAIISIKKFAKNIDELTLLLFDTEIKQKNYGRYNRLRSDKEFLALINVNDK